jgi:hypothetical protein
MLVKLLKILEIIVFLKLQNFKLKAPKNQLFDKMQLLINNNRLLKDYNLLINKECLKNLFKVKINA